MPFTQSHPPPQPQPAVPEALLKDPSGIRLFQTQMLEIINSRFDIIQKEIDAAETRNLDGKRKRQMPVITRNEKMQIVDQNAGETDFSSSDDE